MTFFHAPTLSSLAIGFTLTLVDLCIAQHFALAHILDEHDYIRLHNGRTLLEALESAGLVVIHRDDGELHVTHVVGFTTILHRAVELFQQDLRERAVQPLSNMRLKLAVERLQQDLRGRAVRPRSNIRLKLAAPAIYGTLPFVQSRN